MLLKLINLGPFKTFNRLIPSGEKKKKKLANTILYHLQILFASTSLFSFTATYKQP